MNSQNFRRALRSSLLCGAFSLASVSGAFAEEANSSTIVVTANRIPVAIEQAGGSSTTVITSEQIEASKQTQVTELLKSVPGIDVSSNGGPGSQTSVFLRGSDSKNTLLLVDGVPFNDPASANRNPSFSSLALDNVERIEVIRGAQSVLYGSNATAGVINIITKKGKDKPEFSVKVVGGSFGHQHLQATATGKSGIVNYSVAASGTSTEGFSAANDRNDDLPDDGNTDEEDGYRNKTVSANIGLEISKNFELQYIGRGMDSSIDTDDSGPGYAGDQFSYDPVTFASVAAPNGSQKQESLENQTFNALRLNFQSDKRFFEASAGISKVRHQREQLDAEGDSSFESIGEADHSSLQGTVNFDVASLSFGIDQYAESFDDRNGLEEKASTTGVWIHSLFYLLDDNMNIGVGARSDSHEEFGSAATYRLAPSYQIGGLRLKASYGTGFRAPSLYELYSVYGNLDLDPELSTSWDVGFEHQAGKKFFYGVTWFDSVFEDRIDWVFSSDHLFGGQYQQGEGETKSNGAESFIAYNPMDTLSLRLDHTYTLTEDPEGDRLARRPQHKWYFQSIYDVTESTQVSGSIQFVGERDAIASATKDNGEPVETLDAYQVLNVAVNQEFTDYLEGFVRIDNLTDSVYESAWSYAQSPRAGYLGVKATF